MRYHVLILNPCIVIQRKDMEVLNSKFGDIEGLAYELGSDTRHGMQLHNVDKSR